MAEYNVTALLEQMRGDDKRVDADQGLNAGNELPEDILTTEIVVPLAAVVDLLPEETENDRQVATLESRHVELAYLREDLISARGMSQALALEAIAIVPNFGQGKPIQYYSKHVSQTRYAAAMEEIDVTLMNDAMFYLGAVEERIARLKASSESMCSKMREEWDKLRSLVPSFGTNFADALRVLRDVEVIWNDEEMIATAIATYGDRSDGKLKYYLEHSLYSGKGRLQALVDKDMAYRLGDQLPLLFDQFAEQALLWNTELSAYAEALRAMRNNDLPNFTIPAAPKFSFPKGEQVSADNVAKRFAEIKLGSEEYENLKGKPESIDQTLYAVGDSVYYSSIIEVFSRTISLTDACEGHLNVIRDLREYLQTVDANSDMASHLVTDLNKFTTKLAAMYQTYCHFMDSVCSYVHDFRTEVNLMIAGTMVVVEAANTALSKGATSALPQNAEALSKWNEQVASMRASASFLC